MAKEYLVALFDRNRRVRINDELMGRTNRVIELEAGQYRVSLGPPQNFTPDEHVIQLRNTTPIRPHMVRFELSEPEEV